MIEKEGKHKDVGEAMAKALATHDNLRKTRARFTRDWWLYGSRITAARAIIYSVVHRW